MVRGLLSKLNYLMFSLLVVISVEARYLILHMWEAISTLERLGFCVLGLTCDGASPNHNL